MPVKVTIEDHTGNQARSARIAENTPISKLLPAMVTALDLPLSDPGGRPIRYRLVYNEKDLEDNETWAAAGVHDDDTISIVPEMTAGGSRPFTEVDSDAYPGIVLGPRRAVMPEQGVPQSFANVPGKNHVAVCIRQAALSRMREHAGSSLCEVAGLLMGRVYQDGDTFLVLIETSLPGRYLESSAASLRFTSRTWCDLRRRRLELVGAITLGWYHSHPGFGIFLSAIDLFSHRSFFSDQPWYVAFVVDPVSGEMGAFIWELGTVVRAAEVAIV